MFRFDILRRAPSLALRSTGIDIQLFAGKNPFAA